MNNLIKFKSRFMRAALMLTLAVMTFPTKATSQTKTAYAVLSDEGKTLTFKYEEHNVSGDNEWHVYDTGIPSWPQENITEVVFDASFVDARPKSCASWFYNFKNLTTITGLNYLNTSEVTNMKQMFQFCNELTSLNLSGFNTSKVTNMERMFDSCQKLESITFNENFNTSEVTNMSYMFENCDRLKSLDLSSFDTGNVTTMKYMFCHCIELTSIIFGEFFNTSKVTEMSDMFFGCSKLATVYALPSTAPTLEDDAFKDALMCKFYVHGTGYKTASNWSGLSRRMTVIGTITLGTNVTATVSSTPTGISAPVITYNSKDYYAEVTTFTLGYSGEVSTGYTPVYTATKTSDNSDVTSTVISGSRLTMPAYDISVSATLKTIIPSVAISDITAPVTLSAFDTQATCSTTGVTSNTVAWKNGSTAVTGNATATLSGPYDAMRAYTPMLVHNKGTETETILLIPCTEPDLALTVANEFKGTATDKEFSAGDMNGKQFYVLSAGKIFVRVSGAGTIAAHRCWLELPSSKTNAARSLVIIGNDDQPTSIENVQWSMVNGQSDSWYDMQGRKLEGKPKRKGVYIHGGKIVILRR